MATVYGIIKQHSGSIKVYSEPDKGTVFKLYFPAAAGEIQLGEWEKAPAVSFGGTEKVLIVEDNDAVRHLFENILTNNGYYAVAYAGGAQCLKQISHESHFDLLLTDVVLQDTNGKELYQKIQDRYPNLKVLYMSGYTDNVIVHHGVLEEGIDFIQKPFSVQDLLKKIRNVLDAQ